MASVAGECLARSVCSVVSASRGVGVRGNVPLNEMLRDRIQAISGVYLGVDFSVLVHFRKPVKVGSISRLSGLKKAFEVI